MDAPLCRTALIRERSDGAASTRRLGTAVGNLSPRHGAANVCVIIHNEGGVVPQTEMRSTSEPNHRLTERFSAGQRYGHRAPEIPTAGATPSARIVAGLRILSASVRPGTNEVVMGT